MEIITEIIQTTLNSFDFAYCIIVNILTYIIIKIIDGINKDSKVKNSIKKLVLFVSILTTGVVYWAIGRDLYLLINSAILAPVTWSFIFKPICKKFGIDYKDLDNTISN